jgi:hypothetical protein
MIGSEEPITGRKSKFVFLDRGIIHNFPACGRAATASKTEYKRSSLKGKAAAKLAFNVTATRLSITE